MDLLTWATAMGQRKDRATQSAVRLVDGAFDRLMLAPGDVIVIQSPLAMADKEIDAVCETVAKTFPGHKVLLLDAGQQISAMAPERLALWNSPNSLRVWEIFTR